MGALTFVGPRLRPLVPRKVSLSYTARPERASPAEGKSRDHVKQQNRLVLEALGLEGDVGGRRHLGPGLFAVTKAASGPGSSRERTPLSVLPAPSSPAQQDLPEVQIGLHGPVRFGRILGRQDPVHHRAERALTEARNHLCLECASQRHLLVRAA